MVHLLGEMYVGELISSKLFFQGSSVVASDYKLSLNSSKSFVQSPEKSL